jgi:hypothetical protein
VSVLAPTEERRIKADQILSEHGVHFVDFLGPFAIEVLCR